jgi:2-oxo-4-hydroxy-4-carboxy-5-ureidoimidazoline decarboxylase
MTDVAELDAMPAGRAAELFRACCGAARWVEEMVARRPFRTRDAMFSAADEVWRSLDAADWREAFSHHPRIGERTGAVPQSERARAWSGGEQAGMHDAAAELRTALARANAVYEARFGYICIICATGKSAEELLAITRARLENAPLVELRVAEEEQRKITRLRLEKLLETQSRRGGAPT